VLAAVDNANGYNLAIEYAEMKQASSSTHQPPNQQQGHLDTTRTPKQLYQYMTNQIESSYALSLEVQERYGSS
jgi:hypothetical protein